MNIYMLQIFIFVLECSEKIVDHCKVLVSLKTVTQMLLQSRICSWDYNSVERELHIRCDSLHRIFAAHRDTR